MNPTQAKKRANFEAALASLAEFAARASATDDLEVAGVVKAFEFTYETSWKWMKALLELQGVVTASPRMVFKAAYAQGWLEDESLWLRMIDSRNLTAHTYNRALARKLHEEIVLSFLPAFLRLAPVLGAVET